MTGSDRLARALCGALAAHLAGGRPEVPEAGRPLWAAFCALHAARGFGALGPHPITAEAIGAWACLGRWPLRPHHAEILRRMDAVYLERARSTAAGGASAARAAVTPALFDAMLGGAD